MEKYLIERAKEEIKNETNLAYDVAANNCQMFENVKHMKWFIEAVAEEIANGF